MIFVFDDDMINIFLIFCIIFPIISLLVYVSIAKKKLSILNILTKSHDFIAPNIEGEKVGESGVVEAIKSLAQYAKDFNPDHVIGVHLGGRLTSVLLCEEIGFSRTCCHYIETGRVSRAGPKLILSGNQQISGRILVVDDITRRGGTIDSVSRYLVGQALETYQRIKTIRFVTIAQLIDSGKAERGYIKPDWTFFRTAVAGFGFPWTKVSSAAEAKFRSVPENRIDESADVKFYKNVRDDYDFAVYVAKLSLENPDKFREFCKKPKLYEDWKIDK